jgi:ATP-dependent RNA helicase DeaD
LETFRELGVQKVFIKALDELSIKQPTEIQKLVIPLLLLNSQTDLIGQAQTGTGKTAAYGLPMLQGIDVSVKEVQGLVLCPTRELGQQIAKQLFRFTKYSDRIFTEAVYGGEKIEKQIGSLRRTTHIIVATPGRLIDLLKRKALKLDKVKNIVLDEADEMLSMGFQKELNQILDFVPNGANKWLFSATMPQSIKEMIKEHLTSNATKVETLGKIKVNENIQHKYFVCDEEEKLHVLIKYVRSQQRNRGIIFCRTKKATKHLAKQLISKNIAVDAIHGDLYQKDREKVLRAFKNEKLQFIVATDIAARGLDIDALSFVVHYQMPESEEYYTHRSGRTARAGREGVSMAFVNALERKKIVEYENNLGISFHRIRE